MLSANDWDALLLTARLAGVVTLLLLLIGTPIAWWLARTRSWWRVPVGAVVVIDGRIVAARHNERELTGDPTAHAEVLALRDAAATRDGWRLSDATLVVTLEPCPMCAGAALAARVGSVVFAAPDPAGGALGSSYHVGSDPRLGYEFDVVSGPGALESAELLRAFFGDRRA